MTSILWVNNFGSSPRIMSSSFYSQTVMNLTLEKQLTYHYLTTYYIYLDNKLLFTFYLEAIDNDTIPFLLHQNNKEYLLSMKKPIFVSDIDGTMMKITKKLYSYFIHPTTTLDEFLYTYKFEYTEQKNFIER